MILSRAWVRLISILVPREYRGDWVEEWFAELVSAPDKRMRHALGALPDAWYLRKEGWTMDGLLRDIRMTVKMMIRKPFFTALAGITLAVGIGANTAIFSVVDGVLLSPLPFPESDRLVSANHVAPGLNIPLVPHSEGMYLFYQERFRTLSDFTVFGEQTINLITDGEPQRLSAARVTQTFFDVMGVQPMLGRGFAEGEDRIGTEHVVVLGFSLWQQTFGGNQGIVGQLVEMDGVMRRVVGVMPEGFEFPGDATAWTPIEMDPSEPSMGSLGLIGVGRLAPDATLETAQSEMQAILFQFADVYPDDLSLEIIEQAGLAPDMKPLKELYVQDVRQALWILLGTVGFVLLIACANVANLFLVRAEARQREMALKVALGASRGDIVRQYLTESVTLALGGGLLGLGLAHFGVKGLLAIAPVAIPQTLGIGIDGSVLLFTAIISVGSGFLFGLFPAFGYSGSELSRTLKEGGKATTAGKERHRARSALVVIQVALALVLLVGSALMARSFIHLRSVDPGFDSSSRLSFRLALPEAEWREPDAVRLFYRQLLERMAAIPGVREAAIATAMPLVDNKSAGPMATEENPTPEGGLGTLVDRRQVSPGYFEALGIQLLEGRDLNWEHAGNEVRGVVVSETLARSFWPDAPSVVGRQIKSQGDENEFWEVVGVAQDVRFETLADEPAPLIYLPLVAGNSPLPDVARSFAVVLQTNADPLSFIPSAREALREVATRLPMVNPRTVESIERDAMSSTSFTVILLGIASGIALILGMVGIYGVISYIVSRRSQEIGVRMALGAPAHTVLRDVVGQGMALTGVGIVVGLLAAWGMSRVLSSLLFGVSANDPLTYVGTALGLALVALLASWIPARRAAHIDPVEALRYE
jgi:putative ABC transport system permease protein